MSGSNSPARKATSPASAPASPVTLGSDGRLARVRANARRVLVAEAAWPATLLPVGLIGTYALCGLARLPQSLPDMAHAALLFAVVGSAGWMLRRGLMRLAPPGKEAIDRRIEDASGLAHRPLQMLSDHAAGLAPDNALWTAHLLRVRSGLGTLRAGWPRIAWRQHDRWFAVPGLGAALVIGAVIAGPSAPSRLKAAFVPGIDDADVPAARVQAWITLPDYAPGAPIFLTASGGRVDIPDHSKLSITVEGLDKAPALREDAKAEMLFGAEFHSLQDRSWSGSAVIMAGGRLTLRARGRVLAQWQINVLPDLAPDVAWAAPPGSTKGEWRTHLPWHAAQAYGLASLHAQISLAHPKASTKPRVFDIPIALDGHPKDAGGIANLDLSADPWAGEEVIGRLVATSTSGQTAQSKDAHFTIGARIFRNPVARAVLDLRRRLALGSEPRHMAAQDLAALGDTPGIIEKNTGMFLNLSATSSLLDNEDVDNDAAVSEAIGRLWDLALDIEDSSHGDRDSAQASLDVRAAQEAVNAQLSHMRQLGDKGQSEEEQAELKRRIDALQQAIERRMQALATRALNEHTAIPNLQGTQNEASSALSRLMREMQEDAANGRTADAMKKLQQMEDMTERMRNATPQDLASLAQQMQAQQQARVQADALRDIIHRQTMLVDHTQARAERTRKARGQSTDEDGADQQTTDQDTNDFTNLPTAELLRRLGLRPPTQDNPQPGPTQGGNTPTEEAPPSPVRPSDDATTQAQAAERKNDRAVQHALSQALDELNGQFKALSGKEPSGFKDARTSMQSAHSALGKDADDEALAAQQKALADLQNGAKQMREAMKAASSGAPSFLPGFGQGDGGGGKNGSGDTSGEPSQAGDDQDPLGRSTGEGQNGLDADTHVPNTMSHEKAREIEQELRRRDSDRTRPREELDYLDRLLKNF